ncbi:MAG: alkylhydroperoxidase like protein, AhpD family [Firmicutes bacterium]|nr:alkylhydroperoxidase like protein, AhpD family [Bacillota bacterium]
MILEEKTTILIAVGTSIGANCQPCLQYYIKRAVESGISENELRATINTAKTIRKGAAHKMDLYIADKLGEKSERRVTDENSCTCGC